MENRKMAIHYTIGIILMGIFIFGTINKYTLIIGLIGTYPFFMDMYKIFMDMYKIYIKKVNG